MEPKNREKSVSECGEWRPAVVENECGPNGKRRRRTEEAGPKRRWRKTGGFARRTRTEGGRSEDKKEAAGAEDAGRDEGLARKAPDTPCSPPSAPLSSLLAPAGLTMARRGCHGNS